QVDVTNALGVLCALHQAAQLVLLGDRMQMPPITHVPPPVGAEFLVGSIQTYLETRFEIKPRQLLVNYRSNEALVAYARWLGYPSELAAALPVLGLQFASTVAQPEDWPSHLPWSKGLVGALAPSRPAVALTYPDGKSGQANVFEAVIVATLARMLFALVSRQLGGIGGVSISDEKHTPESFWQTGIGIVTPHKAQRAAVMRALYAAFPDHDRRLMDEAVDTVERFQGGQRDTIVLSFGVGDPDLIAQEEEFLLQLERTNVAISRARGKCIAIISENLVLHLPDDPRIVSTARAIKGFVQQFCDSQQAFTLPWKNGERTVELRWAKGYESLT